MSSQQSPAPLLPYAAQPAFPALPARMAKLFKTRSFWALADQAIASASNYVMLILMGRYLPAERLGLFSLPWEWMMFLNSLHAAMIVYPLSVRGAKLDTDRLRQITTIALIITLALTIPFGTAMFAVGAWQYVMLGLSAAAAIAAFQVHETLRRALMSHFRYTHLIRGDAIGYLGSAGAVLVLAQLGRLSVPAVFWSMAIAFALAAVVQWMHLRPSPSKQVEVREGAAEFWVLGRWMLASNLTMFFAGPAVQFSLAWFQDLKEVGNFQALANLLKLTNPMVVAMTGLIVPAVAAAGHARAGRKYALLGASILAPYFIALLLAPRLVLWILYREQAAQYAPYMLELRICVLTASLGYCNAMVLAVLSGLGHGRAYFYAQIVNTVASILLVIPAAVLWGWSATLIAGLGAMVFTGITAWVLLFKTRGRPDAAMMGREASHE